MRKWAAKQTGFTIVELLIVIVVIAILAAITIVAYTGIQARAQDSAMQTALRNITTKLEAYKALNGVYPATQSNAIVENDSANSVVYTDVNCNITAGYVVKTAAWVPDIDMVLPSSNGEVGSRGQRACYMYQSDGANYILSAWNMVRSAPQSDVFYRRLGWRATNNANQYYLCNSAAVGGAASSTYTVGDDYYKYSYTVSNISDCNETPPSGA
tara:strand:+ start:648 stop:1286 length:639 start_codon:yes stop_codon:yes gene_type:complete